MNNIIQYISRLLKPTILVFTVSYVLIVNPVNAQSIEDFKVGNNKIGQNFNSYLSGIESNKGLKIYYYPEWFKDVVLEKDYVHTPLKEVFDDLLKDTEIEFTINYNHYIVFYKNPLKDITRVEILENIKLQKDTDIIVIGTIDELDLDKELTLTGRIIDGSNGNPIIGASVYIEELNKGSVTNINGYYSLIIPVGMYSVTMDYVNYESEVKQLNVISSGSLNTELHESSLTLENVTVFGESEDQNISSAQVGREQLSIDKIKALPAFLGEVDIIKSLQLLPGVSTVGEGATGFNVRGGSIDQNLVLLDGVQVFNYSHLLGFFSAFNPSTISSVSLYKGGIPAEYGQRISSILDIKMKDGNSEKHTIKGGLGIVSSNLMVEGPIKKGKISYLVAGRTTYSDWLLKRAKNNSVSKSTASFYDFNARITSQINDKNRIILNSYISHDNFRIANDTTFSWSTSLISLKLNHLFNPTLVGNFMVSSGSYGYDVDEPEPTQAFNLLFKIDYQQISANLEKQIGEHKIIFGVQSNLYNFHPGEINPTSSSSVINPLKLNSITGLESSVFISDEFQFSSKLTFIGGFRLSSFSTIGEETVKVYDPDFPKSTSSITDSLLFEKGKFVKPYFGLEPRFSMRYLLNSTSSIKLGYNRIYQYIHLISNTTAATPIDVWQPSNYHIKPQIGNQISLGYFKNTSGIKYEYSIEAYYKLITNILDYKNGAQLILNENLESDLVQGKGRAYGIEFLAKKSKGRLTGWASYTFSQSENKIESEFKEETISNGNYFPTNYNKPHALTITSNYKISRRFSLNVNFTYSTGRPITAPESKYKIGDIVVNNFSERNKYKIPDYHRLDVGYTVKTNHKKNKLWEGEWTVSIYNIYGRKNAYSVFFEDRKSDVPQAKKISVLGTLFPAFSYNFKFL